MNLQRQPVVAVKDLIHSLFSQQGIMGVSVEGTVFLGNSCSFLQNMVPRPFSGIFQEDYQIFSVSEKYSFVYGSVWLSKKITGETRRLWFSALCSARGNQTFIDFLHTSFHQDCFPDGSGISTDSAQRYRLATEVADDIVCELDFENDSAICDEERLKKFYGISCVGTGPSGFLQKVSQRVFPLDLEIFEKLLVEGHGLQEQLRSGPFSLECRLKNSKSRYIWTRIALIPSIPQKKEGKVILYLSYILKILMLKKRKSFR